MYTYVKFSMYLYSHGWIWGVISFVCLYILVCCCLVAKSCPTLCDPMNCSLPGSSVCGMSQARILAWGVISYSRGSSRPRDRTCISCIGKRILYHCATLWASNSTPESVPQRTEDRTKQALGPKCWQRQYSLVKRWKQPKCHQCLHG